MASGNSLFGIVNLASGLNVRYPGPTFSLPKFPQIYITPSPENTCLHQRVEHQSHRLPSPFIDRPLPVESVGKTWA